MVGEQLLRPAALEAQCPNPLSNPNADVGCHASRMAVGWSNDVKHGSHHVEAVRMGEPRDDDGATRRVSEAELRTTEGGVGQGNRSLQESGTGESAASGQESSDRFCKLNH